MIKHADADDGIGHQHFAEDECNHKSGQPGTARLGKDERWPEARAVETSFWILGNSLVRETILAVQEAGKKSYLDALATNTQIFVSYR